MPIPTGPIRSETTNEEQTWARRPVFAFFVRAFAVLGPAVCSFLVTFLLAQTYPPDELGWSIWLWWAVLASLGLATLLATDRVARRLLPLAALFTLSLVFPDQAPSRFSTAMKTGTTRQLQRRIDELRLEGMVETEVGYATTMLEMVAALSVHDRLTRGHCERVRAYTDLLMEELGIGGEAASRLRWAALLHDVGKLFVPQHILANGGRPTIAEWDALKSHTWRGAELTEPLQPWLGDWHRTIGEHHERWDGNGYPGGLAETDIHLGARIVAVADAYDVMTSTRSYKKPISAADARAEIARCAGTQFDPRVARAFLNIGLGRLRLALGPLGWLANLPTATSVAAPVAQPAAIAIVAMATATVATISGGYGGSAPADAPETIAFTADERDEAAPTTQPPNTSLAPRPTSPPTTESTIAEPTTVGIAPSANPSTTVSVQTPASPPTTARPTTTTTAITTPSTARPEELPVAAPPPPLALTFNGTTEEDQPATFQLEAQTSGGPVTFAVVTPPVAGTVDLQTEVAAVFGNEVMLINGDVDGLASNMKADATLSVLTSLAYTPVADQVGVETFVYEVCDDSNRCSTATGIITVTPVADDPRPQDDVASLDEDQVASILDADILANDIEVDGEALSVRWSDPGLGRIDVSPDSATWTPPVDFFGTAQLSYEACDSSGACAPATVDVTVSPINDRPVMAAVTDLDIAVGLAASVTLAGEDVDNANLFYTTSALPSGLLLDPTTGEMSGVITPGQNGQTFSVTATVSDGDLTASRTFDINVNNIGLSAQVGEVGFTEVLYRQTGLLSEVDEFVEITNLTTAPLSLDGLQLQDFDPVDSRHDVEFYGFFPVDTSFQIALPNATLQPGESLVVWMTNPATGGFASAPSALELSLAASVPLLDNDGDDLWLLDANGNVVDFLAYDPGGAASQASTRPPTLLDVWDASFEADLHGASPGQSISLALPGSESDNAGCWELTGSGDAVPRCTGARATSADNSNGDSRTASTGLSNFS